MVNVESCEAATEPPDGTAESRADTLRGARIIIVEDNPFIGAALEDMLVEQGLVVVGVARTMRDAQRYADGPAVDLALLDVNIGDQKIDSVAEALTARGTPVVFATAYGRAGLPEAFRDRPIVEKPFYIEEILRTLRGALREATAEAP